MKSKKNWFLALVIITIISACNVDTKNNLAAIDKTLETTKVDTGKWSYQESLNEMTSGKEYFATITSSTDCFFAYYQANSWHKRHSIQPNLILQNMDNHNTVVLNVQDNLKPELNGHFYGSEISVRFDDKPAIKFNIQLPEGGSDDVVFIEPEKKFITKLKTSKKVKIQAFFYNSIANSTIRAAGRVSNSKILSNSYQKHDTKIMEFDVHGLKWNHK